MTRFTAEWLSLREPSDRAARNPSILGAVVDAFQGATSIRVVDLACGTGATLRALGALLPRRQNWQLLDNPARIRMQTIDSLCVAITSQMPWLARFGAIPEKAAYAPVWP